MTYDAAAGQKGWQNFFDQTMIFYVDDKIQWVFMCFPWWVNMKGLDHA